MRKKIMTVSLALALCLAGFTACGKTEEPETEAATEAATEAEVTTEATTEAASETDAATETSDGEGSFKANYWSADIDESVWTYEESDFKDDDKRSYIDMAIMDGEDEKVKVEIDAYINDKKYFREDLYNYGIDEHDYVDGKVPTENIGGVDLIKYEGDYWGDPAITYFQRLEGAGETIKIRLVGEYDDPAVKTVIDSLHFEVTDTGNVDGPWYWEGEPFDFDGYSATVGDFNINSRLFKMDQSNITHEIFNHDIAVTGGKAYVINDGQKIVVYDIGETGLSYNTEYALDDDDYTEIHATDDGRIYLSGAFKPLVEWKDGEFGATFDEVKDYVALNSAGTFGVTYFTQSDKCKKFELSGDSATVSDISFPEIGTVQHICVNDSHIFVAGGSEGEDDKGNHVVAVYDTAGNLETVLRGSKDVPLGSVTYVFENSNGYMLFDGNMRNIDFYGKDGAYIDKVDDADLFGTYYPWFCSSQYGADGAIYTVITDERTDKSATEVLVFQITGF